MFAGIVGILFFCLICFVQVSEYKRFGITLLRFEEQIYAWFEGRQILFIIRKYLIKYTIIKLLI